MNIFPIHDMMVFIQEDDIVFKEKERIYSNPSLREYSHKIKMEIEPNLRYWDKYKKITNPYECVNTPFDAHTPCVCQYKPISRAFFKLHEILQCCTFHFPYTMNSYHLAEGPGGFIEAILYHRRQREDVYYGMTLIEEDKDVPVWDKCQRNLMKSNKNIHIEEGDGTGNLLHLDNLLYVKEKHAHTMDFVTGDGGFDFSHDFNQQEESALNLIFAEVCFAMVLQKKGGSFVLKVFDTYTSTMTEIIYLLTYLYEEVIFIKPTMSRPANSEKYIVCMRFKQVYNLEAIIQKMIDFYPRLNTEPINSFLDMYLPNGFLSKLKEINSILGQAQNIAILKILLSISDETPENQEYYKKRYLVKCMKWCKKQNLPIHDTLVSMYPY
jgi:23S rRNA U2552 (ribose-2'-O)-methylase RlmE/FtsJ